MSANTNRPHVLSAAAALTLTLMLLGQVGCFGCVPAPESCDYNGSQKSLGATWIGDDSCSDCTCTIDGVLCDDSPCGGATGDGTDMSDDDTGMNDDVTDMSDDTTEDMDDMDDDGADMGGDDDDGELPEGCFDLDNDGFIACIDSDPENEDCDDFRWFVQPGGFEYPGNGIDDNCNGLIDDEETPLCACNGGSSDATDVISALGLCDDTIVSIDRLEGDSLQFGVFTDYQGDVLPKEGNCLAVLSSGNADGSNPTGATFGSGFDDPDPNGDGNGGGGGFLFSDVNDLAQVQIRLTPPTNAKGISFDFMFLSAEWPEFLCQSYNDTFYALVTTEAINSGAEANVSYDTNNNPITVNVGFFELPREWTTPIGNTTYGAEDSTSSCGFPSAANCVLPDYCGQEDVDLGYEGSGSGWLTTSFPISPDDEEIVLTFSIHDESDSAYDSSVILDNLHWVPFEPEIETVKEGE